MNDIPVSIWIAFAITIAGLAVTQVIFSKLEARHPVVFSRLGSPHIFANNTPNNNSLFMRWMFSAEALMLDANLSTWVWVCRVLAGAFWGMFVYHLLKFLSLV